MDAADPRAGLSAEDRGRFDDVVRDSVLATDMAFHKALVDSFTDRINNGPPIVKDSVEDRSLIAKMVLHCADLSNAARPAKVRIQFIYGPQITYLA